jgi:hypothetical protein
MLFSALSFLSLFLTPLSPPLFLCVNLIYNWLQIESCTKQKGLYAAVIYDLWTCCFLTLAISSKLCVFFLAILLFEVNCMIWWIVLNQIESWLNWMWIKSDHKIQIVNCEIWRTIKNHFMFTCVKCGSCNYFIFLLYVTLLSLCVCTAVPFLTHHHRVCVYSYSYSCFNLNLVTPCWVLKVYTIFSSGKGWGDNCWRTSCLGK